MFISEIFHSIQGEGELTGVPSVFVRTSGCNLRCNWCDTMYASWQPEGRQMTIDAIVQEVSSFSCKHVVLTGGEPMIAKEIHKLAQSLHKAGNHITIETAGTVSPDDIDCDLASISPKLSNSKPDERLSKEWQEKHEKFRIQPDILQEWVDDYPYQLKFVVQTSDDLIEIQDLLSKITGSISPEKVLLMPEGIDAATIRGRDESLIDVCKRYGFRYCNRLHIEIFGNKRGT